MIAEPLKHMEIAPVYWYDGGFAGRDDISVHPFAHALHYGSGVFEGIRAYGTRRGAAIFRLGDHVDRLLESARVYALAVPYTHEQLCDAIVRTVRENGLESAYIRPLIFFGEKTISLAPSFHCPTHIMIALRALGDYFGQTNDDGIAVTLSPWQKFSSKALPATAKASGHYANSVLAMQDAFTRGFDEALLLNDRGEVAEGTGENIFLVKDGRLLTNDPSADALDGITRRSVIDLARDRGLSVTIGPIALDALFEADEVFFTGTAAEVAAIRRLDDHHYSPHRPITRALQAAYRTAVSGDDPQHADWLTFV